MDQEHKPEHMVILDLPDFLKGAKDYLLDVSITSWQGVSQNRKHYWMNFDMNNVKMYTHSLAIVYEDKPSDALKLQKEAFSALHQANIAGNRYVLQSDESGLVVARLDTEGLRLPLENSDDLFRKIAKEEAEATLPGICQLL